MRGNVLTVRQLLILSSESGDGYNVPIMAEKKSLWNRLDPGAKVLSVIGIVGLILAALAVPCVMDWIRSKPAENQPPSSSTQSVAQEAKPRQPTATDKPTGD